MKTLYTILFVLLFGSVQSQSGGFYTNISRENYDSLKENSWYNGRVFLTDGTHVDGMIHRNFTEPTLELKTSDGSVKSYNGFKSPGFYMTHKNDTILFVFLDLNSNPYNPKFMAMRLLVDGKTNGISLFRYMWLTADDSWETRLFHSDVYQINWNYYICKNREVKKLTNFNNCLKRLIEDNPIALKYYKKHRKSFKREEYGALSNIVHVYNLETKK